MSDPVLIDAATAHRNALRAAVTTTALVTAVNAAIESASTAGLMTLTYDTTGQTAHDVNFVSAQLTTLGYVVQINPFNIVINW